MEVYIFADKIQPGLPKMNFRSRNDQNPFGECQFLDKNSNNQTHRQGSSPSVSTFFLFQNFPILLSDI